MKKVVLEKNVNRSNVNIIINIIILVCCALMFISCSKKNDGELVDNAVKSSDNSQAEQKVPEKETIELKEDNEQIVENLLKKGEEYVKNREFQNAVIVYAQAAAYGNNKAKYELANLYMGTGVDKGLATARALYEEASSEILDANFALGDIYEKGRGVPKDAQKAEEYYKKAAQDPDTKFRLGLLHHPKTGGLPDAEVALKYLKEAGEGGLGIAYRMAADVCLYSEKYPEVIEFYEKAVALGDVKSMNSLAMYYYFPEEDLINQLMNGIDLEKFPALAEFKELNHNLYTKTAWKHDPQRGLELEKAAAEAGDIPSMNALSQWYASGAYGIPADNEKAQYWKQQYEEHVAQRNAQRAK